MSGLVNDGELRTGNSVTIGRAIIVGGHKTIPRPPDEQRRKSDPIQALAQLGIMEIRLPGIQGGRFPVAGNRGELKIGQAGVIDRGLEPDRGIAAG